MKSKLCLGCCFCFCFGTKISDSPFRLFEYLRRHVEFTLNQFPVYVVRKKHPGHSSCERQPKRHSIRRRMRSGILRNHLRVQPLKTNWLCPLSLRTKIASDVDVSVDMHTVFSANFSDIQCYIKRCTSKLHHSKINRAQKLISGTLYCGEASAAHITTTINSIPHFADAAIFGHFS